MSDHLVTDESGLRAAESELGADVLTKNMIQVSQDPMLQSQDRGGGFGGRGGGEAGGSVAPST